MAFVRYVGIGKKVPPVNISYSVNGGKTWQERNLVAGQTFSIPSNCTDMLIDNVPYNPKGNYDIRAGKVSRI